MNIIDKFKQSLKHLTKPSNISVQYWVTFEGFYSPEWRDFKLDQLWNIRTGLKMKVIIRYNSKTHDEYNFKITKMPGSDKICILSDFDIKQPLPDFIKLLVRDLAKEARYEKLIISNKYNKIKAIDL